jgi:hypothetical protein
MILVSLMLLVTLVLQLQSTLGSDLADESDAYLVGHLCEASGKLAVQAVI